MVACLTLCMVWESHSHSQDVHELSFINFVCASAANSSVAMWDYASPRSYADMYKLLLFIFKISTNLIIFFAYQQRIIVLLSLLEMKKFQMLKEPFKQDKMSNNMIL